MAGKRLYFVQFTKIGNGYQGYVGAFEASSVAGLEPEIQEFVTGILGEDKHAEVTLEPLSMKGQINYGLLGNFTVISD